MKHHHVDCDCGHDHAPKETSPDDKSGWWASMLPLLACAVCPACLSAYAKVLSAFGVGLFLSETQHAIIMAVAVTSSILVSAWRSVRSGRRWPLAVSLSGSVLIVLGHLLELAAVEWLGVVVLLVGGLVEMPLLRKLVRRRLSNAPA
ncbi:MAG: MerC domain-containing protein [Myxococcales bacterium]|nr:MerC domain-containing protein [Myxococcales bacterium]